MLGVGRRLFDGNGKKAQLASLGLENDESKPALVGYGKVVKMKVWG